MHRRTMYTAIICFVALCAIIMIAFNQAEAPDNGESTDRSDPVVPPNQLTNESPSPHARPAYVPGQGQQPLILDLADLTPSDSKRWFWQTSDQAPANPQGWQEALSQAHAYRNSLNPLDRLQFLQHYQVVLDQDPPPDVRARVMLEMGAAMSIYFSPRMESEAIVWYADILSKHPGQTNNRSVLTAKIHLAEMLSKSPDADSYYQLVNRLFKEVINSTESDFVFDDPSFQRLNIDSIQQAEHPSLARADRALLNESLVQQMNKQYRDSLLKERNGRIETFRRSTMNAWIHSQMMPGMPEINRIRLAGLRSEVAGDEDLVSLVDEFAHKHQSALLSNPDEQSSFEDDVISDIPGPAD